MPTIIIILYYSIIWNNVYEFHNPELSDFRSVKTLELSARNFSIDQIQRA